MTETVNYYGQAIEKFKKFSQDDWLKWISGVLHDNPVEPVISFPKSENINTLFWVYNVLLERKNVLYQKALNNYCHAITKSLELTHTMEANYDAIYTLIYFVNDTRPFVCRHELEMQIRSERLEDHFYYEDNLLYLLIKAYIPIEDSVVTPLKDYLNKKFLYGRVGAYFYYVYFIYHHKYTKEVHYAFEAYLQKKNKDITEEVIQEIMTAYEEIVQEAKSFRVVNSVINYVLKKYKREIPEEARKIVLTFPGLIEIMLARYDLKAFELYEEAEELLVVVSNRIDASVRKLSSGSFRDVMNSEEELTVGPVHLAASAYGGPDALLDRFGF